MVIESIIKIRYDSIFIIPQANFRIAYLLNKMALVQSQSGGTVIGIKVSSNSMIAWLSYYQSCNSVILLLFNCQHSLSLISAYFQASRYYQTRFCCNLTSKMLKLRMIMLRIRIHSRIKIKSKVKVN